jgi:putative transposase
MARPLRIQFPGAFYHITCRGNERKRIFLDNDDRYRFLEQLGESLKTYQVILYAYVMMSNHFHLIVQTVRANLSEFMRRFNICYTGWVNYHHDTCGHLYQGRYKALLVDADSYLLELSRYIHFNKVRVGRLEKADFHERWKHAIKYRWSSLPGYMNKKHIVDYVEYDMILAMIGGRRAYQRFLVDGLKTGLPDPFVDVQYQTILGDSNFVARVKSEHLNEASLREQPAYRHIIAKTIPPELIMTRVAEALGVDVQSLSVRLGNGVNRGIAAELLYRYSGIPQHMVGKFLGGIDYTAVSMLRRRLKTKMAQDTVIKAKYDKAEQGLRCL